MSRYLIFSSLATAQARSAEQAHALRCDGESTARWWSSLENAETQQGALQIEDSGPFGVETTVGGFTAGLTPDEVAFLWAEADMAPSWFPEMP